MTIHKKSQTTQIKHFRITKTKAIAAIGMIAVLLSVVIISSRSAKADQFDAQINALNAQISQNQAAANQKSAEADTLQNKIAILNSQIAAAQAALNKTKVEVAQTNAQIDAANKELDHQKSILKDNLRIIYKQGEVSPIEVVASSKDLSDFVAQQQYLGAIKQKIDDNLKKIDQLKKELDTKKSNLTILQTQQQAQSDTIASQRAEQSNLLEQTRGDEARYQQQVASNKQALNSVVAARAAALSRGGFSVASSGGCGGYPSVWCNAPQDSITDNWSYPNRECTSYVAWKRWSIGRPIGQFWGNAGTWSRFANTSNPSYGDIVVFQGGDYGHVAIVESNNGSSLTVSEFNFNYGQGWGKYGSRTIPFSSPSMSGARFIH